MTVMREAIDTTTLGWIKPELDETLRQARQEIETYAENPVDASRMRMCASHLHQVHGTLRMVELYAPAMVAEEMERLSLALQLGQVSDRDDACAALMRGVVLLPDYLERLQGGHRDIPIVLLPLLNELRAARGEPGLNESVLFSPDLDRPLPQDLPTPVVTSTQAARNSAAPHLTALREALNAWPEDSTPSDPARLAKAIDGLLGDVVFEPVRRMLWVASSVAAAMGDGALPATRTLRQAFAGVEREARQILSDNDFSAPRSEPAAEPTRQLLYHVAHSTAPHPALEHLRETFDLDAHLPSESELEHARGSLSGRNRALLDTVSAAIKEDLLRVKDTLDLHLRTGQTDVADLQPQVEALGRVGDTLGMMGLGVARNVVLQQRDAMREIVGGQRPADEGALLDIAGALLYVDASLDDQVSRLGLPDDKADDDLLASESRKVLDVVVREAIANFGDARQSFVAFVETGWDHAELVEVPRLLDEVSGALRILDLPIPAGYLAAIKRFTEYELIERRRVPNGQQLDTLADALSSLEYYLEALRAQRPNRDNILDIARQSLETLNYWPLPDTWAAPSPITAEELAKAPRFDTQSLEPQLEDEIDLAPAAKMVESAPQPPKTPEPAPVAAAPAPVATTAAGVAAGGFEHSDDIDDEIREVFLEELEEEIAHLGELLPAWRDTPEDSEKLRPIRRVFHTLKGSGRLVGAKTLGEFSWKIENMLNRVLDGTRPPSPAVIGMVEHAYAVLPQLHDALRNQGAITADLAGMQDHADRLAAGDEAMYVPSAARADAAVEAVVEAPEEAIELAAEATETVEAAEFEMAVAEVAEPVAEPAGMPASIDQVLLEILGIEVNGHLATIDQWLIAANAAPIPADDSLQRAIHTLNGAFAMTEVPVITEITAPTEAYIKRLLASGAPASEEGLAALAAVVLAIRQTLAALQSERPRVPLFSGLAERMVALRDSLPDARAPMPLEPAVQAYTEADFAAEEAEFSAIDLSAFSGEAISEAPTHIVFDAGEQEEHVKTDVLPMQFSDEAAAIGDQFVVDSRWMSATMLANAADGDVATLAEVEAVETGLLETERLEVERLEAERAEAERIESERLEAERAEAERLEAERLEAERVAAERTEAERLEAERAEAERLEAERLEAAAAERTEAERLEAERLEAERLEAERLEAERLEAERLEAERLEAERLEAERLEAERLEAERLEAERLEAERLEAERLEAERLEAERLEAERFEAERLEAERLEAERVEAERAEADRLAEEEREYARLEAEYAEAERLAREQAEAASAALEASKAIEPVQVPVVELAQIEADEAAVAEVAADEPAVAELIAHALATSEDPDEALDLTGLDPELVDIFVEEGVDLLDHSDGLLARLRETPEDREMLAGLQRDLHTLKGGARMAGIMAVGELGHAMESLLEAVVDRRGEFGSDGVPLLERGFDRLHAMITRVGERRAIAMPAALIAEFDARSRGETVVAMPVSAPVAAASAVPAAPKAELKPLSAPIDEASTGDEDDIGVRAPQEQVRIRADLLDRLVNYAGEVAIYRARLEQQLGAFRGAIAEMAATNTRMRDQLRRLDIETEAQIIARYQREHETTDTTFDPLELDRFSTLQQLSRALAESAADQVSLQTTLDDLTRQYETLLLQQSRVSSDLQEGLMRTRTVPFEVLQPRLRRVVRQASGELGKQVQLKLDGAQGELDRNVLDRMTAPLEHMLRNAVAHGLETPEKRKKAHKPEEGTIHIAVRREGSEVVLEVGDDGAGLDRNAIRRRGEERGLVRSDAVLSDAELDALILEPGFSTADEVSRLAGRGVGMDVVASEVRQLGGTLDIRSTPGRGVTFTLRLPQTLAVTEAVFVRIGETTFAVPIASVRGVGRIGRDQLVAADGSATDAVYRYGGEDYAVHDLGNLVGQSPAKAEGHLQMPLLLIRAGDLRAAVCVDQVVGNREIVVKPVGPQVASLPGIFGATIMGDGRVVVILDVAPLVRRQALLPRDQLVVQVPVAETRRVPLVMVVDDSVTMRKVTGRVLERHNFEVATAKDGLDALERMVDVVPDLMLLDIEMPRMDGYELASAMKADPRLRRVPIVMITSRTGDKHRQRAFEIGVERYLGKPYQEHELLRNVFELLAQQRADEDGYRHD
nr:Hpt domain-containing protein [Lysobacter niastensis]